MLSATKRLTSIGATHQKKETISVAAKEKLDKGT